MRVVFGAAHNAELTVQPMIGRLLTAGALTLFGNFACAAALEPSNRDVSTLASQAPIAARSLAELHSYLRGREANVDLFRMRGPFGVAIHENRNVGVTRAERIKADLFLSSPAEKAPLVIFLHGHDSSKGAHARQAAHLASWGMHSLSVQLPGNGPWETNGRTLSRLVSTIYSAPEAIDTRVDRSRIILVGHSFGAYAVAFALAGGAPAAGAILLDPAAARTDVPNFLRRIRKPVMVIGADEVVSPARNRELFYELVRNGVAEVSIRDAAHEDAQYPSEFALQNGGVDPSTTEALQVTFVAALTAAAVSLSATGAFEYAWMSFRPLLQDGRLFNAKRK